MNLAEEFFSNIVFSFSLSPQFQNLSKNASSIIILLACTTWTMAVLKVYTMQVDHAVMMMCGGIPWQAYFQRVLSSRSATVAKTLSVFAGFGCFCAAIPAVVVGRLFSNFISLRHSLYK